MAPFFVVGDNLTIDQAKELVISLLALPKEAEWVEFKLNNANPQEIGEYLSALSNAATLHHKESGYLVWGIEDAPGNPVLGTTFKPFTAKYGNEDLEPWLARMLAPRIHFKFYDIDVDGKKVVLLCIQPAPGQPVRFSGADFIRVGANKKPLKEYPEKERALWATLSAAPFERGTAAGNLDSDRVLRLLDYPAVFRALNLTLPAGSSGILERLEQEKLILRTSSDRFNITNLGAVLFAHSLNDFDRLTRKALRVVIYRGDNRVETVREQQGGKGYAVGFSGAIRYINEQLPQNEQIGQALRQEVRMYPELAIRELVANALIHQDFNLAGTGPMVEIFSDRMEITNPGTPLINPLRFIDEPPQSRNETLASLMRRMNMCEERGSGIDKVIFQIELFQLPAPTFLANPNHTRATLFSYRKLTQMNKDDRVRACYQHACLLYASGGRRMTNATLRARFGIAEHNAAIATRIITESVDSALVKSFDPSSRSKKHVSYVPFWA